MNDLRKEVEDALKEGEIYDQFGARWGEKRIDALRAALAQPDTGMPKKICGPNLEQVLNAAGFYKRKPLTEEEIAALSEQHIFASRLTKFVRAIEKAHGIVE